MATKTDYFKHDFNLSNGQLNLIIESIKSREPITLKLSKKTFTNGSVALPLTKADANKVIANKGFSYILNKSKIKLLKLEEKDGAFLPIIPLILAGITALGATAGAATGIAKTVIEKKNNDAKLEEEIRHNKEIEKIAAGSGVQLQPWGKTGMSVDVKEFVNNSKLPDMGK